MNPVSSSDLEIFGSNGIYIPYCISNDDLVVLIVDNCLVRAARYDPRSPKVNVQLLNSLSSFYAFNEYRREFWYERLWERRPTRFSTTKKKRNRQNTALYNLNKGEVLYITERSDKVEISRMLRKSSCYPKERIDNLIDFTKLLRRLYNKYF